ncbi:hypothetical protein G9A89_006222 [Geosiphon pyriformis]|nr:hypothetical protein G9A89_006222 [Geosiphon pyriformis]
MASQKLTSPNSDADEVSEVNPPKKQRKKQYRWNPGKNIILLKEIQLHLPFTASYGQIKAAWTKVADGFNAAVGECVINHRQSLRASDTEEEYEEQEILLTELVQQWDDSQEARDFEIGQNKKKIEKDENEAEIIRQSAMRGMVRKTSDYDTSSIANTTDEEGDGGKDIKKESGNSGIRKRRRGESKADFIRTTIMEGQVITKSITQLVSATEQAQKDSQERLILEREYREKDLQLQKEKLEYDNKWKEKEIKLREMEIEARQKENEQRIKILELELQLRSLEHKN